ncbi:MAG TPA: PD-(D/E)XK nuclease family protein, partial [Patescibacteria group bacterium]|nr:PD-(D/E)XK nuclease family protein [Patescibacteria group bacterium]
FYGDGKRERKISPFVIESVDEKVLEAILKKQTVAPAAQQLSLLEVMNANIENNKTPEPITTQEKPTTNLTYISYSQLQTYQMCPLHYKLRYLMHVPSAPAPALSYGISVHATLRDFFQKIQDGQKVTAPSIADLLKENWINQGYTNKTHADQSYKQAEKMLIDVAAKSLTEKPNTLAIELPFNFWLNKKEGSLKVGGRIDRIDQLADGRIEIIDYKTGQNVPSEKKVKEDLQLSFYALAATMVKDKTLNKTPDEVILTLYYLEANQKFSTTRTKEELEKAKETILSLVEEIEHSEFRCTGGMFCKSCEYSMLCQGFGN